MASILEIPAGWGPGVEVTPESFDSLTNDEVLAVMERMEAVKAWADYLSLAATQVLTRRAKADALADVGPDASAARRQRVVEEARSVVADEIILATGFGPAEAGARVAFASAQPGRCLTLRARLREGATSWWRARTIFHDTQALPAEDADEVAVAVLAPTRDSSALSNSLFRQRLSRQLARRMSRQQAHLDALSRRGTSVVVTPVGTADLLVTGDALRVVAAHDRVAAIARQLRNRGDQRTLAQLRSDITLDLLMYSSVPTHPGGGEPTVCADAFSGDMPPATVTVTVSRAGQQPLTTCPLNTEDTTTTRPEDGGGRASRRMDRSPGPPGPAAPTRPCPSSTTTQAGCTAVIQPGSAAHEATCGSGRRRRRLPRGARTQRGHDAASALTDVRSPGPLHSTHPTRSGTTPLLAGDCRGLSQVASVS